MAKIKGESKSETKKEHDSPKRKISTSSKKNSWWTQKEEHRLLALVSRWKKKKSSKLNDECWEVISLHMVNENGETMGKTAARCKSRYKKIKKEDAMIVAFYKKHEASGIKLEDFQAFSKRIPERTALYLHRRYAELAEKVASWEKKTKKHRKHAYATEAETRQDASPVFMRESQLEERDCTMKEYMYVNNMDTQLDGRQIQYDPPPYNNYKNHEYDINPNDFIESYPQNLDYNYPPFEHEHYDHAAIAYEPAIGGNISESAPSQHHEQVNNMIRMTPSPHDHQCRNMFPISRLEQKEKVLWSPKLDKEASMDDDTFELGELSDETLFESLNQDFSL